MKVKIKSFLTIIIAFLLLPGPAGLFANNDTVFPSVKIGGYAQIRFEATLDENATPTYTIPATRIELKADVWDYATYVFSIDSAGGGTFKLYDSYIKLSYTDAGFFDARIGQFKYNFSREQSYSDAELELINKSYVVSSLVAPTREIGAEISRNFKNAPLKPFVALGGFNGSGPNSNAQNDYGALTARAVISPLDGLCVGGSYYDGKTGSTKTTKKRHGYEVCYENRSKTGLPILIKGEYIAGLDGSTDKNGYYITAGYNFFLAQKQEPPAISLLARYDSYDSNSSIPDDEITRLTLGTIFQYNKFYSFRLNYEFRSENPPAANDLLACQLQVKF